MAGKVGIYTFHNVPNYGAILQAFALCYKVNSMGFETHIIDYQGNGNKKFDINSKDKYYFQHKSIRSLRTKIAYTLFFRNQYIKKLERFEDFRKEYLPIAPYNNGINDVFDFIIYGSDQIWNPRITNGYDITLFGDGARKAISYAASVGDIAYIKDSGEKVFLELIDSFDALSVREESLYDYIKKELRESECSIVLDPVFLLDKDIYIELAKKSKINKPTEDYILVYQLERYPQTADFAKKIAREKKLRIIEICGTDYIRPRKKNLFCDLGPLEFLSLIYNASYVITNSFHGTAFSIIFHKDFNSVVSKSGKSRVYDLLNRLGLNNRIIDINGKVDCSKINYSFSEGELNRMRNASIRYIKESLQTM